MSSSTASNDAPVTQLIVGQTLGMQTVEDTIVATNLGYGGASDKLLKLVATHPAMVTTDT
jgi:hypothetical protein